MTLGEDDFMYFGGSDEIAHGKVGVATGHLIFWNEGEDSGSAEIVKRRLNDSGRDRSHVSKSHVQCWVEAEKRMLRDLVLDSIPAIQSGALKVMIVLDADRCIRESFGLYIQCLPRDKVTVIGGGRISDGFVVAPELKEALVDHLKNQHHLGVLAFGDSPLDLKMLSRADKAFVVIEDEASRSRSMDLALKNAIENDGLKAKQCLRPNHVSPRLTTGILPELKLLDPHFVDSLLSGCGEPTKLNVISVDKLNPGAVKILMTPMRDMSVQGPRLSKAHRDVGWYLAATFLPELIGVEDIAIPHVQGHMATGHQLWGEDKILIVALMRALFVHASQPTDPQHDPLNDRFAIILVDSVVNSGRTILDFDMQAECVSGGILTATLAEYTNLQFITLRISENKYKGTGATDTGNRLFNTLHLP
ncbi:hypothetical protein BDV36DRAFT_288242 [Aspergillus pseudocaelatus]|uniref:Phosphoribosyltransferase domain-containing protein n=1 Tax=Aspergillus pseudocaelatus TaxID=1825620 RepID=A0ABQ6W4G4_9EURO|nr:hypothetical protein BDV36DRAFT_288242 [Aspergillus pseudocaelatus]